MRILFFGASQFGLNCLKSTCQIDGVEIVGIVTMQESFSISYNKDGVKNVLYADFFEYSESKKIPFYRMENSMKENGLLNFIEVCNPDFGLVVGWYHMIPKDLLAKFPIAGLHASLLPEYSGGAPLVWAMINGEKITGISFFLMDSGVDSGLILMQKETPIYDSDTIKTLYERIENLGIEILNESIPKIIDGTIEFIIQDESKRSIYPQRTPLDGEINWNWDCIRIKNFIRAQTRPYPGAYFVVNSKKIIIWDADIFDI